MVVRKARPFALILALAVTVFAQGITGVWKGQVTDPQGVKEEFVLDLKAVGETLTGTLTGIPTPDTKYPIANGKREGHRVSFAVNMQSSDAGGASRTFTFTATVDGNQMKGSVTGPDGQRVPFTAIAGSRSTPAVAEAPTTPARPGGMRPPNPQGSDPTPRDAREALLAAFDKYEVVGGMNPNEGNKDIDDFILALIRHPAFPDKVNDIAVECGNSLYQPVLDRYIRGEDVPLSQVQPVWRNTTQPICGVSALYQDLFPLVRRINEKLPQRKKLRVLALDPPIDWDKVTSMEDLKRFGSREPSIASVMEQEVFSKHRKALIIIGIRHIMHHRGASAIYEQKYPNLTFVVSTHWNFGGYTPLARFNDELEKRMVAWPVPSLVSIEGTWLADLGSAYFSPTPDPDAGDRGFPGVDGYLYLGPRDLLLRQPIPAKITLDKDYMAELQRRADIRRGPMRPERMLQEESDSGVFFYDPAENKRYLETIRQKNPDN